MTITGFEQALIEFALGTMFAAGAIWFAWMIFNRGRGTGPTVAAQPAPPATVQRSEQKPKPPDKAKSGSGISMKELSARTFTPMEDLETIEQILLDKRAVVLYGPPGTGKTKTAAELCDYFTGPKGEYEVVVFHASYSYEDFVEGLRPRASASGAIDYPVVDGPLKRMASRARTRPKNRFVLLIDEINRGNLARIFGELILMLEYRNYDVLLPYSGERFQLPDNVYFLGTMNSADRGIALVDYALRRRFSFIEFAPSTGVLARYFHENPPRIGASMVINLFTALNRKIRSEKSLGPSFEIGQAFFMEPELDQEKLERIWRFKIQPLLAEYYFDRPEELGDYSLERMITA